jgi:anti-anti-sigma factor
VPLYACDLCGFTSAAFRVDAAAAHRLECPDCDGVVRIIFRSDQPSRGPTYASAAGGQAGDRSSQEDRVPTGQPGPAFAIREHAELDGTLRLTLLGDLDLTAADTLSTRLAALKTSGCPARLDLSKLAFIDSTGIQALLLALTDARWTGWQLDVAPKVSPSVQRAAQIMGIAQVLWPLDPDPNRRVKATSGAASTARARRRQ